MFAIGGNSATGYNLTRSLRFRASASAYLNRTPASTGNRQIWTWSGWVKRGTLSSGTLFGADGSNYMFMYFSPDSLDCGEVVSSTQQWRRLTTQVFRDPSSWYHIVFAFDSTQATAANRVKLYVNGSQVTAFSTSADPSLNYNSVVNTTVAHSIGSFAAPTRQAYLDGYLTEVNFTDGQALTPSSFGSTNTLTGVWQPARYTGSYGTNGFYLPFTDNSALTTSSNAGLGKDFSGNGNYWTTNNISITAGVTYDSMTDVCTLTSATAANFPTLNPLNSVGSSDISAGNLTRAGGNNYTLATMGMPSGKWYAEMTVTTVGTESSCGVATAADAGGSGVGNNAFSWGYFNNGNKYNNGVSTSYGASYTSADVIGIAFDNTIGTLTFYKNNVSQGAAFTSLSANTYFFAMEGRTGGTPNNVSINFGQRPFTYTPPTGFVALNTFNLPTSTIVKGNTVMDATLYTGTGASLSVTNAASFKPDFVWTKSRSNATDHKLTDSVRGVTKALTPVLGAPGQTTDTQGLTAFNSNGFTLGTDATYNGSARTFVGWQWQAGQGSTSSNTNGTITSTVSVNATAGFSLLTYTGTGTNGATVGHGLGVAPSWIIVKSYIAAGNSWQVYHVSLGNTGILVLEKTDAVSNSSIWWNNTSPTSSVFSLGTSGYVNASATAYVAYCWTPIAGFSAFGSYTGNGLTDGVFVYTPFRPKFVMIKMTSSIGDWYIYDSSRDPYNATQQGLLPNSSGSETTYTGWGDFLSNGFKIRRTDAAWNSSGGTYIYAAFAENPFKNSLAR